MFILGIDGGGTSCRAAVADRNGSILGRATAGAANIRTDLSGARAAIIEAASRAFEQAGLEAGKLSEASAVLGLAGANVGTYAQELTAILPFSRCRVETDALIALEGAVGHGDGAMAIVGTGSTYLARKSGELFAVGGWGFLIGDQGSGSRIGRDLLEESLLAHDGVVSQTTLTQALLTRFSNQPGEIVEFTKTANPGDFGALAPLVLEHAAIGDTTAHRILERAQLAIEASLDALPLAEEGPLCLLGGLAAAMTPRLSQRFQAIIRAPQTDALGGAVALAARYYGGASA